MHVINRILFISFGVSWLTQPICFAQNFSEETTVFVTEKNEVNDNITIVNVNEEYTIGQNETQSRKIPLYIGAYFSFGGGWDCSGIIVAVQMALDHINERDDILSEYELKMIYNDTQCSSGLGTRVLFDQLFREPQKIALLGDGCSTSTQAIAGTSYHWNLVTMSYSASSPALTNRKLYPYFYRTIMPDTMFNPTRIQLIKHFGWTRVATIHENHEIFSLAIDNLLTLLSRENITVISSESFAENPRNQVNNLKEQDAQIIIMNMYQTKARRVFCEAYKLGMTGHVWLLLGWYSSNWWKAFDDNIDCTIQEMSEFVENSYYIGTETQHLDDLLASEKKTIANITTNEFNFLTRERLKQPENRQFTWNNRNPQGYDATWALALMLNETVDRLKSRPFSDGQLHHLEDFTYDDDEMRALFMEVLPHVKFDGVSGSVSFHNGDRIDSVRIEQLQRQCDKDWYHDEQICYKFVNIPKPYQEAATHCQSEGASLIHIHSHKRHVHVFQNWKGKLIQPYWYIGLRMISGKFVWEGSGKALNWQPPGVNLSAMVTTKEKCVFASLYERIWTITDCDNKFSFICQKTSDAVEKFVALYVPGTSQNVFGDIEWKRPVTWPGNVTPLDHTPEVVITTIYIHHGIELSLYVPICSAAGLALINALVFLVFNVKYRKQRHVKMSSPNLNNLIIVGCILVYLSVIVGGIDTNLISIETMTITCQVQAWLLSVGFVMAFGSMFSKTWRVHQIAAFKTPKRRVVTDFHLFLMVLALLLFDVIILIIWQVVDPLYGQIVNLFERDDSDVPNQRLVPYIEHCTCNSMFIWLTLLYGFKGLLLVFGAFLAWETRKVTLPALNDSKLIGISVYNVVILCAIGVAVSIILDAEPASLYIFTSSFTIFCTTATLLVVFVPKMRAVRIYPDGEPTNTMNNASSAHMTNASLQGGQWNGVSRADIVQLENKFKLLLDQMKGNRQKAPSSIQNQGQETSNGTNTSAKEMVKQLIDRIDAEITSMDGESMNRTK